MIRVKYDKSLEVTKKQYHILINKFKGIIAHRKLNNKYYIKLMIGSYKNRVETVLELNK